MVWGMYMEAHWDNIRIANYGALFVFFSGLYQTVLIYSKAFWLRPWLFWDLGMTLFQMAVHSNIWLFFANRAPIGADFYWNPEQMSVSGIVFGHCFVSGLFKFQVVFPCFKCYWSFGIAQLLMGFQVSVVFLRSISALSRFSSIWVLRSPR